MNFNSWQYLLFLPIVLFVYFVLPHKVRWVWLLAASYFFYMSWNFWLIFLILSTTIVSYFCAYFMDKTENHKIRKLLLILTLVVSLGALVFFKYFNFLYGNVISILNFFKLNIQSRVFDIILPVGISFYTFQTLSYVIDVYKGKYKAEKHFGYYALFVSFFPQLVAGPIERADILIPQLKEEHYFNFDDFACGFRIVLCGFFYKCVLADTLGVFVNNVFSNLENANWISLVLAGILFSFEMYGDFNGYSEIAVGSARIMGIKLSRNFNRPYLSKSFSDYFRRWHMTLNSWFTEYVYIPLGGSRKGVLRKFLNVMIVFLLCGLWHGANWTYVLWGIYSGLIVCIETLLNKPLKNLFKNVDINSTWISILRIIGLFILFIPGALIFRASSVSDIGIIFQKLFTFTSAKEGLSLMGIGLAEGIMIVLLIVSSDLVFSFGEIGRTSNEPIPVSYKRIPIYVVLIIVIATCWLYSLSKGDSSAFAYFQF